jgi:hypothetical protein
MVDGDEAGDRGEALDRIVGQLGIEAGIDHERHFRPDQERVAVGGGLGDIFRCDLIVGAGLVLDDDLLAPGFGETLRQRAAEGVGDPAGRRRYDDRHRFGRITRSLCGRHRRQTNHHHSRQPCPHSPVSLRSLPFCEVSLIFRCLPMVGAMRQSRTICMSCPDGAQRAERPGSLEA